MSTVTRYWIEIARKEMSKKSGTPIDKISDRQMAILLGITPGYLSKLLNADNDNEASDQLAYTIAQIAQVPPMQIVGEINALKASKDDERNYWKKVAKTAVAGFSGVALSAGLMSNPTPAHAETAPIEFNISTETDYILYEPYSCNYTLFY